MGLRKKAGTTAGQASCRGPEAFPAGSLDLQEAGLARAIAELGIAVRYLHSAATTEQALDRPDRLEDPVDPVVHHLRKAAGPGRDDR